MTGAGADPGAAGAASVLRIDLDAVAANYRALAERLGPGTACAAAVKADAYGLGAVPVARRLAREGCAAFFVATIGEGAALRRHLPSPDIDIAVLNGVLAGTEAAFVEHRLIPVANDLGQVARWRKAVERAGAPLDAMLHVDTGMNRLGLPPRELDWLAETPELLEGPNWRCLLSHLACADEPEHPMNAAQLARFRAARARLPRMPASLANSGGIFLGADYAFDLARPGIALYGGNPRGAGPNPMRQAVTLLGRVLQVRDVAPGESVGYGAAHRVAAPGRVAIVAAGYADGYLRSSGGRGHAWLGGVRAPVIGRVSMDLVAVDATRVPPEAARPGALAELLGGRVTPDDAAWAAGTISYEMLAGLGRRYRRVYEGDDGAEPAA